MSIFKKKYKDLTEKEQELLERRMAEYEDELSEKELEQGALGGVSRDVGDEAFNETFGGKQK